MYSYKLLERVLKEQCLVNEDDAANPVEVKAPKQIPSDSLQNPSDPDATYSGHKGQGYQVQIMETYADRQGNETKHKQLNLITHVEVEPAHESDAHALMPALESTQQRDLAPKKVLADTLYGSVEACPAGHKPEWTKKKKTRHTAAFNGEQCSECPHRANCPAKPGKKYHSLHYTEKELRTAKRRAYEQTEEFKATYRMRAGIEATMSEFDRRTGVKQLRVRGLKAVRFRATLKALGINILRAATVLAALINGPKHLFAVFSIVKERLLSLFGCLMDFISAIILRFAKTRLEHPIYGS